MRRVAPEEPQDTERFDPRIDEPSLEPSLIPVIRPSASALPPREAPAADVVVAPVPGERPADTDDRAPAPDPVPAADAPLTEPPLSEPVPTSVLASAGGDGLGEEPAAEVVPDAIVPEPLKEHGPEAPPRARRRTWRRRHHRAVFEETLPTQALVMVDRLQASPYGRRMRSTLEQRREAEAQEQALEARTTLDFALKLGETMFSFGASSLDVETSIIVVTQAYGIHETEVDLTNQAISLNYAPDSSRGEVPYTLQRVVRSYSTNFQGLAAVHQLVEQISEGAVGRQEAQRRLVEIRHRPAPYPPFVAVLAAGVFAAAFIPLIGGTWSGSLLGMGSTLLVFWSKIQADRARFPEIYSTLFGAFLATLIALGAYAMDVPVNPAIVVAGGIMMLLPTARFVTAVQDAINGFPVTSAGRFISAALVFVGLMGGIMAAVAVAELAGFPRLDLAQQVTIAYPTLVLLGLVVVATMADGVVEQTRWELTLGCGAVAGVAFLGHELVGRWGFSAALSAGVAATIVGFLGRVVALRLGAPPLVVVFPGVLFLLPGFTIFRGLYEFTVETVAPLQGVSGMLDALIVIVSIAAGAVLGDTLGRPFTDRMLDGGARSADGHQR